MGTWFTLSFFDNDGKVINEFVLNSPSIIRKDPFFYQVKSGNMQNMIEYLQGIEERK